jgi:NAD(P)-dependent dehydrogenase (short-subunit alcohol dehydrogenase family)
VVVQLTRDLGVHLARSGVRVNAVLLGPIETPDQQAVFDHNPGALEKRLTHWPMGRFGTLAEATGTMLWWAVVTFRRIGWRPVRRCGG